jgi:hypothetical protein
MFWAIFIPIIVFILLVKNAFIKHEKHQLRNSNKSHKQGISHPQLVFTSSVMNTALMFFIIGKKPIYFWIWHCFHTPILMIIRFFKFKKEKQHYFLYDFCYWVNLYSLLYVWIMPNNAEMFRILFILSNGPLAWSIIAFRCSLVLHDLQHMTSVFLHFSPMALCFCIRWYASDSFIIWEGLCDQSSIEMIYSAMWNFYMWWVFIYYLVVLIALDKRIKRKKYTTLFTWMLDSPGLGPVLKAISPKEYVQKGTYVLGHYAFTVVTMIFATFLWNNFYLHFFFMLFIGAMASWNGAGYYLTVFSRKEK